MMQRYRDAGKLFQEVTMASVIFTAVFWCVVLWFLTTWIRDPQ